MSGLFEADQAEFERLLERHYPELSRPVRDRIALFRDLVVRENERQNLTRLVSPQDFLFGHVADCIELCRWADLSGISADLGSGVGVPGIPSALISGSRWVLIESEGRKADFLSSAVNALGALKEPVAVYRGRGEDFLKRNTADRLVIRAVGSVSKLYRVVGACSTWNKAILLKGPKFETEWEEFKREFPRSTWNILRTHNYSVAEKSRLLVELAR